MTGAAVMVAVTVPADPASAFTLFTRDIGRWWGRAHEPAACA